MGLFPLSLYCLIYYQLSIGWLVEQIKQYKEKVILSDRLSNISRNVKRNSMVSPSRNSSKVILDGTTQLGSVQVLLLFALAQYGCIELEKSSNSLRSRWVLTKPRRLGRVHFQRINIQGCRRRLVQSQRYRVQKPKAFAEWSTLSIGAVVGQTKRAWYSGPI